MTPYVLAVANGALSVYKAMMAGFSWMKGALKSTRRFIGNLVGKTLGGVPGALFDRAGELFGQAVVSGAKSAGNVLMAEGDALLGSIAQQKSMDRDEWCAQYGQGICITASWWIRFSQVITHILLILIIGVILLCRYERRFH